MKNFIHYALRDLIDPFYEDKIEILREQMILKKDTLYFDWTASGLGSHLVEKRMLEVLPYYANTHSNSSKHAMLFQELYEASKIAIKKALGLGDEFAVIACGNGASGAIKKFQELTGIYLPPASRSYVKIKPEKLPLVIVGGFEHHSNEISFREGLCELRRIKLRSDFSFDLESLQKLLEENQGRKIIISCNIISNVTGNLAPYEEIARLGRKYGAVVAFDMATSFSQMKILPDFFDACFLAPHKLLGGVGSCGLLCIRKNLVDTTLAPSFSGGGVVRYVDRQSQIYKEDIEEREEAGTPPILQLFRAILAIKIQNEVGYDFIRNKKSVLMRLFQKELANFPEVKIYGQANHYGVLSFNIKGVSPFELAYILSTNFGIQTRAGCSCAGPYGHDLLELEDHSYRGEKDPYGWLRVSLHYTHHLEDIERFFFALKKSVLILNPRLMKGL